MIDKSITTLSQLVSKYEECELELTQVPHEFVDRYGYACLANSLMFKEPTIPKYNIKIAEYMKNTKFNTLSSLTSYINKLQNDIDKLFAIFSYAALNIEYDVKLCFSGETRSTTLEEVFKTKKAVCSGYAIFYEGMAKKVGIDSQRIIINGYSNFSKSQSYDPLNRPKKIRSNHASIYVTIDNVPFISEPTWASGQLTPEKQFERNFRPNLFLIPFYKSLCDHYPCDESQELLKINFPFSHFFQSLKVDPFGVQLKTESNPFVNITSSTGYIEQIYSCIGPIDSVTFNLKIQKEKNFFDVPSDGLTSYEIMQTKLPKHPNRCRFKTYILFPDVGFFKIEMFIDGKVVLSYFVDNLKKSSGSIPIKYNPFHKTKFIAMRPKNVHSDAETGAIIRFAVSKYHSNIRLKIFKLENDKSFDEKGELIDPSFGKYIKLEIPFDNERYEIQLCVIFPSNGRYSVSIFLESLKGSFVFYVKYFFDVNGVDPDKLYRDHPIYYMCKDRNFAPIRIFDKKHEVFVRPNQSCYVVNKREQTLQFKTSSIDDKLYFEFKKNGKTVVWPKIVGNDGEFQTVNFVIPEEFGEYWLKGWVNDNCCINLVYIYRDIVFKDTSFEEKKLLELLKNRIYKEKSNTGQILNEITQNKRRKSYKNKNSNNNNLNSSVGNLSPNSVIIENNDNKHRSEIDELMKIIENLKKENENSISEIEKLKNENEKIKLENKNSQTDISKPQKENEVLDTKIEDNENKLKQEIERLKKENEEIKKINEKLIKENKVLIDENKKLTLQNDEKAKEKDENEILKKQIEELKKEIDELKKEKKENKTSNAQDNKLKIIIDDKTKEEMEQLKKKIDDLQKYNEKLKKENENSENSNLKKDNERLNTEKDIILKENETLKKEIKKLNMNNDEEKIKKVISQLNKEQIIYSKKKAEEQLNSASKSSDVNIMSKSETQKSGTSNTNKPKLDKELPNPKVLNANNQVLLNKDSKTNNSNIKQLKTESPRPKSTNSKDDQKTKILRTRATTPKSVNEKLNPKLSNTTTMRLQNSKEKQTFSNTLQPKSLNKIITKTTETPKRKSGKTEMPGVTPKPETNIRRNLKMKK